LVFNGSSSIVRVADSPSLDLSAGMTLEAWVDPSQLGSIWRTVVLKENSSASELVYALYGNSDSGQAAANVFTASDTFVRGSALPLNTWSFLAATYDGSTLRLFVNGTLSASLPVGGSIAVSSGPLDIGGNGVWAEWFNGLIDNVRIYDRPLAAADIQTDMNTPVSAGG
jgi:hypothetical protein